MKEVVHREKEYRRFEQPAHKKEPVKKGYPCQGICIQDTKCENTGKLEIKRGTQVLITDILPQFKAYKVTHEF